MTPLIIRARRKLANLVAPNYYHPKKYKNQDNKYFKYATTNYNFPELLNLTNHTLITNKTTVILLHGMDTIPDDWLKNKYPYYNLGNDLFYTPNIQVHIPYLITDPLFGQKLRLLVEYRRLDTLEILLAQQIDELIRKARRHENKVVVVSLSWGATVAEYISEPLDLLVIAGTNPDPIVDYNYIEDLKRLDPQFFATKSLNNLIKNKELIKLHKSVTIMLGTKQNRHQRLIKSSDIYIDLYKAGHSINPDTASLLSLIKGMTQND